MAKEQASAFQGDLRPVGPVLAVPSDPRFRPDRRVALVRLLGMAAGTGLAATGLAGCSSSESRPCRQKLGSLRTPIRNSDLPIWLGDRGEQTQNQQWSLLQVAFLTWREQENFAPGTTFAFNIDRFYNPSITTQEQAEKEVNRMTEIARDRLSGVGVTQSPDYPNNVVDDPEVNGTVLSFYAIGDCPTPPALEA